LSKIDLINLNKVDTELVLPSTSENTNLQKLQENKWGSILNNQTFNTLNNNIKLLKNSLVETINTLNNENIVAKNKYINEENNIISLGDNTKKLNFLTTQIQVNGVDTEFLTSQNLSNISNIAYKDKENTFTFPLNTNQYKINSNQVISDDNDNINIGNSQRKLNLQSSDGKLYLNGQEFKGGSNNENQNVGNNDEISEYLKKSSFSYYFEDLISFDISYQNIDNEKIKKTIVEKPDNKLGYVYYTGRDDLYFFGIILGWDFKKTNSYKKLGKYFKDNFKKLKKISNNYKIYLIVDYQENIKLVGINGKRIFFNCVRNEYNTVRYDNSLNSGILNFEKFIGNSENEDDVVRFILLNLSINLGKDVLIIDNTENNFNINNNDEEVSFQFLANNIIMLNYRRWTIGSYLDYLGGNITDSIINNKFNVEFLIKGLKFVPR
jgi:hypothetical protein